MLLFGDTSVGRVEQKKFQSKTFQGKQKVFIFLKVLSFGIKTGFVSKAAAAVGLWCNRRQFMSFYTTGNGTGFEQVSS